MNKTKKIDVIFDIDHTLIESVYLGKTEREIEDNKQKYNGLSNVYFIEYYQDSKLKIAPHLRLYTHKKKNVSRIINKKTSKLNKSKQHLILYTYAIFIRPYAKYLLNWCYTHANVSIWTAGTTNYAINILKGLLTPQQLKKTKMIITRDNLNRGFLNLKTNKIYEIVNSNRILVKNMNFLFKHIDNIKYKFDPNLTFLIDDLDSNYEINRIEGLTRNMIKISPWSHNDTDDNKLHELRTWLKYSMVFVKQDKIDWIKLINLS